MRKFQMCPGHGPEMTKRRSPLRLLRIVLLLPLPVQRLQFRQYRMVLGLWPVRQLTRMLTRLPGTTGPGINITWVPRGLCRARLNFMVYDPLGGKFHLQFPIRRGLTLGLGVTPMVLDIRFMVVNRDEEFEEEIASTE